MRFIGIIAEYDPFHNGHAWQLAAARALGAQRVAVALSCGLTQRGTLPLLPERVRVQAALLHGADLVVANPAPCACAGAEAFARAGVRLLAALGCDALAFGAETPDAARLMAAARVLCSDAYTAALRDALASGARSFAAARQTAVEKVAPGEGLAELLKKPNNNLAIEYCKAILEQSAPLEAVALPRIGAVHNAPLGAGAFAQSGAARVQSDADALACHDAEGLRGGAGAFARHDAEGLRGGAGAFARHDAEGLRGGADALARNDAEALPGGEDVPAACASAMPSGASAFASASALRALWGVGGAAVLDGFVPPQALALYREAERDGLAASQPAVDLALLSRLRAQCGAAAGGAAFAHVRGVSEGLENRLCGAVRTACTAQQLYDAMTTVRYPRARMRRLCMDAALGYAAPPCADALHAETVADGRPRCAPPCADDLHAETVADGRPRCAPLRADALHAETVADGRPRCAPPCADALHAETVADGRPRCAPPALPPYLHILGARKSALPLLKNAALPASVSLAKLSAQNEECRAMAAAQCAAADFAALCRCVPAPMGLAFTQKPVLLDD